LFSKLLSLSSQFLFLFFNFFLLSRAWGKLNIAVRHGVRLEKRHNSGSATCARCGRASFCSSLLSLYFLSQFFLPRILRECFRSFQIAQAYKLSPQEISSIDFYIGPNCVRLFRYLYQPCRAPDLSVDVELSLLALPGNHMILAVLAVFRNF